MITLSELRDDLMSHDVPLSSVLRKAYVFARKLGDPLLVRWIKNELHGYNLSEWENFKEFPSYRRPEGILKGQGPHGIVKPIIMDDERLLPKFSRNPIPFSIAEIESSIQDSENSGVITFALSPAQEKALRKGLSVPAIPFLEYVRSAFIGILEAVRNNLLEFVLDLEEKIPTLDLEDIDDKDRETVERTVIQVIQNPVSCFITGTQTTTLNWGHLKEILKTTLSSQGVDTKKSEELIKVLEEGEKDKEALAKKYVPKRVAEYIDRNKDWITSTVIQLINTFFIQRSG